jgi:hypothetical protein
MVELVIFLLFIGAAVFFLWIGIKGMKAQKQKKVDSGAEDMFTAFHVEGLGLPQNTFCDIYRFQDKILIDAKSHKFEISYEKLRAAAVKSEQELIEKGKSVVGRAIIGTLLVPGLGTIVGGMSGIGNKKKKGKTNYFLILNYTDRNGDLAAVTFANNYAPFQIQRFGDAINKALASVQRDVVHL